MTEKKVVDIKPGMLVYLDDARDAIYEVNGWSPNEQWATLKDIRSNQSIGSHKANRLTPVPHGVIEDLMRDAINSAKVFADGLFHAPR